MRAVSETWTALAAGGDFRLEAKLKIGENEYDKITAPRISAPLLSSPLSVGSCMAKTLKVSILTEDKLRSGTEVEVLGRLTNGTAATVCSEWKSFGVFRITTLDDKAAGGIVTVEGFDDMLLTNKAAFTGVAETVTAVSMKDAVDDIAASIGVPLDERTVIHTGTAYMIPVDRNQTQRQVLGYIAACHGGNWVITADRKLRLVPLVSAAAAEGETVYSVPAVIGSLTEGEAVTVSGVSMTDSMGKQYTAGDSSGYVVTVSENPCACNAICGALLDAFEGLTYAPYTATTALYDPALEPGDHIAIGTRVTSILCNQEMKLDHAFRSDITVPNSASSVTQSYPYTNPMVQTIRNEVKKMAGNLQVEGSVSADALYAPMGDVVDLTVTRVCTSRRIPRYLARDMSDDNYVQIERQGICFWKGTTDGTTEQATNPDGELLYWEADVSGAELKNGGWPYVDDARIFTTTEETQWPVTVYVYVESLERTTFFVDWDGDQIAIDYFGAPDENNRGYAWVSNELTGASFLYRPKDNADVDTIGVKMNADGYMDLYGMRETSFMDFSEWQFGKFYEMLDGVASEIAYDVEFDDNGRPVKITQGDHVTEVRWWQE